MVVGVIGTGNMGQALVKGLIKLYGKAVSVLAYDKRKELVRTIPRHVTVLPPAQWNKKGIRPDVVVIAVKPQDIADAVGQIKNLGNLDPLWLSIAAGVSIESLQGILGSSARICRAMPNTPALVGQGISAYALSASCTADDVNRAERVLAGCGKVVSVQEKLINAITGLSGSGPAYVDLFIESLIEGGITAGLPSDIAQQCAIQTVIGAGVMALESGESVSDLKRKVMSPGGTTARGLLALERGGFKAAVMQAVLDATRRAEELGGTPGDTLPPKKSGSGRQRNRSRQPKEQKK